jgi:hypothetical protein
MLSCLAGLCACRSSGHFASFVIAPRGGQERGADIGPELGAAAQLAKPAPPDAGAVKAPPGRGKDQPAAAGVAPFESAASSGGQAQAADSQAREPGSDRAQPSGMGGKPFESARSTGPAQAAADGAARPEGHDHPSPTGPAGEVPAGGSGGSGVQAKKPEVPVQDLAHRPFRLRGNPAAAGVPAAGLPPPGDVSGAADMPQPLASSPPPLTQLDVDMSGGLQLDTMLVGAYRIQISTSPDFSRLLFSKVYDFMEDPDVYGDIAVLELRKGTYWVRYAFFDLLGLQHPFARPRAYFYRPPEKRK